MFAAEGTEVKRAGPVAPNLNAYAERYAQTLRKECLHRFLILGEKHPWHVVDEWECYYLAERPHQGVGNVPLPVAQADSVGEPRIRPFPSGEVVCRERLGGLLEHCHRKAA